jgi:hypothetical protein
MPLPTEVVPGLYFNAVMSPGPVKPNNGIGGTNVDWLQRFYNCQTVSPPGLRTPRFQVSDGSPRNFLYVSNCVGVAYGVLPRLAAGKQMHVVSDNFSGCEFHVVSRTNGTAAAFLHVYRGGGAPAPYTLDATWAHKQTFLSSPHFAAGMSLVAYAYVVDMPWEAYFAWLRFDHQMRLVDVFGPTTVHL